MSMFGSTSAAFPAFQQPAWTESRAARTWAGVGIALAGFASYANSFGVPFVYLDVAAIVDNPSIRHLWPIWSALRPPTDGSLTVGGRPLLNLSLALNYAISGTQPWSYHLVNVLIHVLAGLTLFGVVRRTIIRIHAISGGWDIIPAFLVALVWTVHPLQTESVTYIVQRAESLMGLFYLLTLYCFIRGVPIEKDPRDERTAYRRACFWFGLSWLCCLCGMATKEVMVSAPVIALLYDRTFLSGGFKEALRLRGRFFLALAATWLPLGWFVWSTGGNRGGTSGFGLPISWWTYFQTQFPAVVHYLRLCVWPHPLIFYYEVRWYNFGAVAWDAALIAALALATLIGLWRRSAGGFLGACFFAILAPTSLIPGMSQTLAEHRMYLASAAVAAAIVLTVWKRASGRPAARVGAIAVFVAAAVGLGALTVQRNAIYGREETLWADTVAKAPGNPFSRNNLGIALAAENRPTEAIEQLTRALELNPDYPEARDNFGLALAGIGRFPEAIAQFERALQLKPVYPEASANLGLALASTGRLPEAIAALRRAVQLKPDYREARNNLAVVLAGSGRTDEAIAEYERVLSAGEATAEVHYNLANALAQKERWPEAADHYRQAVALHPGYLEACANLGVALAKTQQWDAAIAAYRGALALAPDDPDIHYNLSLALRAAGSGDAAAAESATADRLRAAGKGGGGR
jgi:tetratricopeptide (TPR) repeat protein